MRRKSRRVKDASHSSRKVAQSSSANPLKRFLKALGPGFITGASDDDPSGIGTYAMVGASAGYGMLWTAWVTFPLMAAVQFICAKVGMVGGEGIAGVLRRHYSKKLLYVVVASLFVANTVNAAADIMAIAAGINLLLPLPISLLIAPLGLGIVVMQIWGSYRRIAKVFKWLTLTLFAYIGAAVLAKPDWMSVLQGTIRPTFTFDRPSLEMIVAILGTTISPYLFFWQASQEVEEEVARGRKTRLERVGASRKELHDAAWDVNFGMLISNVVMFFIILAAAATLHQAGKTDVNSAADAAEALRPLAGDAATWLMALGLIGTGILAVPILTGSAGYAVCETFGWNCKLDAKFHEAKEFYLIIGGATVAAVAMDYFGVNPMDALFWTAIVNGCLAPPLMLIIMLVSNNSRVVGSRKNGLLLNILGWAATLVMFAAAATLIVL